MNRLEPLDKLSVDSDLAPLLLHSDEVQFYKSHPKQAEQSSI